MVCSVLIQDYAKSCHHDIYFLTTNPQVLLTAGSLGNGPVLSCCYTSVITVASCRWADSPYLDDIRSDRLQSKCSC